MTALIADTSPILRNIPTDPADRRSFEFMPSPMPARYLPEGSQDHRRCPSPHSYTAREVPAYPHRYGYTITNTFAHGDSGVKAFACNLDSKAAQRQQLEGSSSPERPSAMWRKDNDARPNHFHGEASARHIEAAPTAVSVSAPSRSPSPSSADLPRHRREHHVMPTIELTSSPPKSLTGRIFSVRWISSSARSNGPSSCRTPPRRPPCPPTTMPTPSTQPTTTTSTSPWTNLPRSTLQTTTDTPSTILQLPCLLSSDQSGLAPSPPPRGITAAAAGSGEGMSGGGPAYSGSTADAACLLATLPQRMLDRGSMARHYHASHHAVASSAAAIGGGGMGMMPPALVSASGPPGTPVRVQASGRRGPRGQSRFKGVCITRAGKWRAVIYIGRKQKYLGVFDSEFDAARAYDAAALQHFAEGAKLNFPDGIERQLNDISSVRGRPFPTAGAGGGAAPRSCTPPAFLETAVDAAIGGMAGSSSFREAQSEDRVRRP